MGSRLDKKSTAVSKAIQSHNFDNEEGDEYEPSAFGGFPEYFRRKKIKLQNLDAQLRADSTDNPPIFRGVVAHVNGYTQPSLNDLHHMIVSYGGGFIQYLDGKTQVTHIIASNLTPKKAVEFKRYRIVKPAWIVDSLAAGKLLPWESYRVVDEGAGQKLLQFDSGKLGSQLNQAKRGYRDQTDTSWYTKQFALDDASPDDKNDESEERSGKGKEELISGGLSDLEFSSYDAQQDEVHVSKTRDELKPQGLGLGRSDDALAEPGNHLNDQPKTPLKATQARQDLVERGEALKDKIPAHVAGERSPDLDGISAEIDGQESLGHNTTSLSALKRKHGSEASDTPESKHARMTAEEHNADLLSDPRIRKSSVLNPNFLEQYYRESRLHHLSTWKADLKSQLQALTAEKTASQKARQKRSPNARRYVLHVDFDSFFVAVSLKNFPQLADKPAVVAHGSGSGSEIASCNYAARAFGVKNGMWMKRAQDLCDHIQVLPYDFPAYEAASRLFYDSILNTGGIVQSVSIDEALVDISALCHATGGTDGTSVREGSIWREQEKASEIAQGLRDRVKEQTGCAVSVGIGGNILLAKVALRKAKPAGQYQIKPEDAIDFLGPLEVQNLPGVAYSIGGRLEEAGIKFVKDIREVSKERLISILGPKTGEKLHNYARGIDKAEVGDQVVRKSVSAEVNWGVRFETQEQAEEFIESLCGELHKRLTKERVRGRNLTMKIMRRAADAPLDPPKHLGHGKCDTYNKSVAVGVATNDKDILTRESLSMLRSFAFSPGELRGLGVQMTKLEPIKAVTQGQSGSSQRRLQFNANAPKPAADLGAEDPDLDSSQRRQLFRPSQSQQRPTADIVAKDDIQDDPETPHKPTKHSQLAQQFVDSPSKKPLNTLGTQFVLPTQVDPAVLSELPREIRDRLTKNTKLSPSQKRLSFGPATKPDRHSPQPARHDSESDEATDRPHFAATALPSESQLDPAILAALPEDLRAEILSQYNKSDSIIATDTTSPTSKTAQTSQTKARTAAQAQAVLPQSPRKARTTRVTVPTRGRGRPRGSSLLSRLKGASSRNGTSTLTQANFVAAPQRLGPDSATESDSDAHAAISDAAPTDEPDPAFLAALPPDIRAEITAHHRAAALRRTGIEVSRRRRGGGGGGPAAQHHHGERTVKLPPRDPRPTFSLAKLHAIDDLRAAMRAWVAEFAAEGPYDEDVGALCVYLGEVVVRERDLRKAVDVARWVAWVVSAEEGVDGARWADALERCREAVRRGCTERGLGMVDLGDG